MVLGYQVTYDFPSEQDIELALALRAATVAIIYAGLEVLDVDEGRFPVVGHRGATFDVEHTIEYVGIYLTKDCEIIKANIYVGGETGGKWADREVRHI